jgi:hypothetical protein
MICIISTTQIIKTLKKIDSKLIIIKTRIEWLLKWVITIEKRSRWKGIRDGVADGIGPGVSEGVDGVSKRGKRY